MPSVVSVEHCVDASMLRGLLLPLMLAMPIAMLPALLLDIA